MLDRESVGATARRGQEHCDASGGGIHHLPGEICRPSRRRLGRSWQVGLHKAKKLLEGRTSWGLGLSSQLTGRSSQGWEIVGR